MKYIGLLAGIGLIMAFGALAPPAWAITYVDLELVLLVDVSGSVDSTEFGTQRDGYVAAFNSSDIYNAVDNGPYGSIAATLVYWSEGQEQAVGWTQIYNQATSEAFATAIGSAARPTDIGVMTAIGDAIDYAVPLFGTDYDGTRLVIDISGDGKNNAGDLVTTARDNAISGVVDTINGLAIQTQYSDLRVYFETNVIGGTDAFAVAVDSFATFGPAVKEKLVKEITVIPEPVTMAGLMLGIGCLARYVRKRRM